MEQMHTFKKVIFSITGGDYMRDSSGTSKVVKAHEEIFTHAGYEYVVMFPISLSRGTGAKRRTLTTGYYGLALNGDFLGVYTKTQILKFLFEQQKSGNVIAGVLIHHVIRSRISEIKHIVERIKHVKIVYYIHDFYTCCINYNLLRNDETSCVGYMNMCKGCSYEALRSKHMADMASLFQLFEKDTLFIAPSAYVRERWLQYYPQYAGNVIVISHQKSEGQYEKNRDLIARSNKVKVGYVGAQTKQKGWDLWNDILKRLPDAKDNYEFIYFGNGSEKLDGMKKVSVEIHRQGKDAMIRALRMEKIDIVFLGSVCGETYSYTLFEAHASNCYILAMETSGNIAYTVQHEDWGKVFRSSDDIIAFLRNKEQVVDTLNAWKKETNPGAMRYIENDEILKVFEDEISGTVNYEHNASAVITLFIRKMLSISYNMKRK